MSTLALDSWFSFSGLISLSFLPKPPSQRSVFTTLVQVATRTAIAPIRLSAPLVGKYGSLKAGNNNCLCRFEYFLVLFASPNNYPTNSQTCSHRSRILLSCLFIRCTQIDNYCQCGAGEQSRTSQTHSG